METWDAIVVGSGPNGLAAAIRLAQHGASVLVLEASDTAGGGMRTAELTLPGFHHDVCSGCHPTGFLSPFFQTLPLAEHGLTWAHPDVSVAHPLDDAPAVLLHRSVDATADGLGPDGDAYRRLMAPLLKDPTALLTELLAPLHLPRRPDLMLPFAWRAWRSATGTANAWFREAPAKALIAG